MGFDAAGPDDAAWRNAGVGVAAQEGRELAGEDVVAKDAGREDFAEEWFRGLFVRR